MVLATIKIDILLRAREIQRARGRGFESRVCSGLRGLERFGTSKWVYALLGRGDCGGKLVLKSGRFAGVRWSEVPELRCC